MGLLMEFGGREIAEQMLAAAVAERLRDGVAAHGKASLVASGGESPRGMLAELRVQSVPWEAVTVVPSDERWVAVDDPASNEGLIRRELMQGRAAAARLVGLYRGGDAEGAVAALDAEVAAIDRPFDVVVLGVGTDGHTASLFPASPDIAAALRSPRNVVVQRPAHLAAARISLTLRALLDAREVYLLFFGAEKRAVYERALEPGPPEEYPLRAIVRQPAVRVTAFWAA